MLLHVLFQGFDITVLDGGTAFGRPDDLGIQGNQTILL